MCRQSSCCPPPNDSVSVTSVCISMMCTQKKKQQPHFKLKHSCTKHLQFFTSPSVSPIVWKYFTHRWAINCRTSSHLWRLYISIDSINEGTNNRMYHVNSTMELSLQQPSSTIIQRSTFSCHEDSLCREDIRKNGNGERLSTVASFDLTARRKDVSNLLSVFVLELLPLDGCIWLQVQICKGVLLRKLWYSKMKVVKRFKIQIYNTH